MFLCWTLDIWIWGNYRFGCRFLNLYLLDGRVLFNLDFYSLSDLLASVACSSGSHWVFWSSSFFSGSGTLCDLWCSWCHLCLWVSRILGTAVASSWAWDISQSCGPGYGDGSIGGRLIGLWGTVVSLPVGAYLGFQDQIFLVMIFNAYLIVYILVKLDLWFHPR